MNRAALAIQILQLHLAEWEIVPGEMISIYEKPTKSSNGRLLGSSSNLTDAILKARDKLMKELSVPR